MFDEETPRSVLVEARRVGPRPPRAQPTLPPPTVKPPRRRDRAALLPAGELVSVQELMDALGLSRSTLHRLRATPTFPKPLQISVRRVAFRTADIRAWLATRERSRRACMRDVPAEDTIRGPALAQAA